FGLQAYTDGLAGAISQPAAIFAELGHATNGNIFRGYSSVATAATLMSLYQEDAAFTGTGLLMDLGNDTGSFNSGDFINLKRVGTTQFVVKYDGMTGIGTSTPWRTLSVDGTVAMPSLVNDSTGYYVCLNTTTGQLATSTTACGASSERFKENIAGISYGLNSVLSLRPVSFDYKQSYVQGAGKQVGFIAEEVATIMPELVAYGKGGTIEGLDYPKFTAVLVKASQELYNKVATLENIIGTTTGSSMLQYQSDLQNHFTIATTGSATLLSTVSDDQAVFAVSNASSTLATITGKGNLRLKGTIIFESDSVAGSIATDGTTGLAEVDFENHLGTGKPSVQLTPEGDIPTIAQITSWKKDTLGNYIGFFIKTFGLSGQSVAANVHYAVFGKQEGYTTSGNAIQVLSNTISGSGGTPPTATTTSGTATATATSTESVASTTAPVVAPVVVDPASATSTEPVATAVGEPATSTEPVVTALVQ
ncbi:MAG: tail fiber domain-containing protein, partial [Candidatus Paceibacterota bacterium]